MPKQELNNLESASIHRTKLNENFTELYETKANTNHASSSTDYGIASPSLFGHVKVTQANGLAVTSGVLSIGLASTTNVGAVQLVNDYNTNDSTKAATAAAVKGVKDAAVVVYYGTETPSGAIGKDGDLYCKTA